MKPSIHKQAIVALFLLGITAMAVVFVYAQTVNITKMLMVKKTGARVEKALNDTAQVLQEKVQSSSEAAAEDVYSVMLLKLRDEEGVSVILVIANEQLRHRVRNALPLKLVQYGLDGFRFFS